MDKLFCPRIRLYRKRVRVIKILTLFYVYKSNIIHEVIEILVKRFFSCSSHAKADLSLARLLNDIAGGEGSLCIL